MSVRWRKEEFYVSLDSAKNYLRNRHATMIWAFILFSLITLAPPNVSDNADNVRWRRPGNAGDDERICLRKEFLSYLQRSGQLSLPVQGPTPLPVFGPQLPSFYEQYRRHAAERDDEDDSNTTISTGIDSSTGRVTREEVDGKHRLEVDLDRLLAKENRLPQNETAKENKTASTEQQQPQQQESDPPLPSFNEWTKQKLEEQQQTKQQQQQQQADAQLKNGSPATPIVLPGSVPGPAMDTAAKQTIEQIQHARNYASKECGAKVLLANPQAQHASSVLNEKEPDEYMLNPCNAEQKFFVVELCETVQITRLDLANFELFSSSPKDFRVFVSERYPAAEWTFLGSWTAEDQRKIQNFPVERRVYAKYVKVELLSHYGSEHFCPLSLIRVLGVSVVEEYEAEAAQEQRHRQQLDPAAASPPAEPGEKPEGPPSLFESSLDAAENASAATQPPAQAPAATAPEVKNGFMIRQELLNSAKDVVVQMAKGVIDKAQAVFGGSKSADNGTDTNKTAPVPVLAPAPLPVDLEPAPAPTVVLVHGSCGEEWRRCLQCDVSTNVSPRLCGYVRAFLVKRRQRILKMPIAPIPTSEVSTTADGIDKLPATEEVVPSEKSLETPVEDVIKDERNQTADATPKPPLPIPSGTKVLPTPPPVVPVTSFTITTVDSSALPGVATTGKETVFARLNNRIRALETNISLSGEYLGELSLRYRKQMDEMQKALNRSNSMIAQYTKTTEEKLAQYRLEIETLQVELEKLKAKLLERDDERERKSNGSVINETTLLGVEKAFPNAEACAPIIAVVEIVALVSLILYCCRGRFGTDERVLDALVERRVRQILVEEMQKLRKNGVSVNALTFGSPVGNGHLPLGRSEGTSLGVDVHERGSPPRTDARWQPQLRICDPTPSTSSKPPINSHDSAVPASTKPKKKPKKRQQAKQVLAARKSSDTTAALSSRNETREDLPDDHQDDGILNDSSAGILFSTSNPSTAVWRRVLPSWRRATLTNQQNQKQRRRGSDDRLNAAMLNPRSKRKFHSQNAFEVLASPSSSSDGDHSRSPEKRPRAGRGPS